MDRVKRMWPFLVALAVFLVVILGVVSNSYAGRLPGADRMCEDHIGIAGDASCQLGTSVEEQVSSNGTSGPQFEISAYDPIGRVERPFTCVREDDLVTCTSDKDQRVVLRR